MNPIMPGVIVIALLLAAGCQENEAMAEPTTKAGRVLGLDEGWELAPRGAYSAVQAGGVVAITAKGENPTAGYEVKLVQSPLRIWPPRWMLARKRPEGMVAQVITPFEVSGSFESADPVKSVRVNDAAGGVDVPVERK